jgi:hypothetical protein
MNKLVARFADGRMVKGTTLDFSPGKEYFHITLPESSPGSNPTTVQMEDLKALFFVKDFAGDPGHVEKNEFDSPPPPGEHRVGTTFRDGEVLMGTTPGYRPGFSGFFLVPADSGSNNERCYIMADATREVRFL